MLLTIELTIKISKFEIEICILKTLIRIFVDQLFKNIPCGRKFCILSSHESRFVSFDINLHRQLTLLS